MYGTNKGSRATTHHPHAKTSSLLLHSYFFPLDFLGLTSSDNFSRPLRDCFVLLPYRRPLRDFFVLLPLPRTAVLG